MKNLNVPLALIGISHKTASVEIREKVALDAEEQKFILNKLLIEFNVDGCMVISTCNRTEIYLSGEESGAMLPKIQRWLDDYKKSSCFTDERYFYVAEGQDAVRHLFSVISSLDSQIIGEPQITGQVKEAYDLALELKTTDTLLNKVVNFGIKAQKRIRSDTFLADGAVSISFAGVELARKIFVELDDKRALLIGAGETAELAALHFLQRGIEKINIVNRTSEKADELAERFQGTAYGFDQLHSAFENIDIVISATASQEYVLNVDFIKQISKERRHKPLFIIDLAIPRDVDPEINRIDGVYLYNLDDLHEVVQMNLDKRKGEIAKSFKIIERYVEQFEKWMATHSTVSTINMLKGYFEDIRLKELARLKKRLPVDGMPEIEYLTQSIMNKLMHQHIKTLKKNSHDPENQQRYVDFLHSIYELDKIDRMENNEES